MLMLRARDKPMFRAKVTTKKVGISHQFPTICAASKRHYLLKNIFYWGS